MKVIIVVLLFISMPLFAFKIDSILMSFTYYSKNKPLSNFENKNK